MKIGYIRPTYDEPDVTQQIQQLSKIEDIQIIIEEHDSAKKRPSLNRMIQNLQAEDIIYVSKLCHLADSSRHLNELLDKIHLMKASVISINEKIDSNHVEGYSFQEILRHLIQFQSDVISEKTKSGLNEAQKKGNNAGRPKKPDANVQKAILMYESKKYTLAEIKEATGISKSTLYRNLEN